MRQPLPDRLSRLARARDGLEKQLRATRLEIGEALIEVRDDPNLSLTGAGEILGISRPTVYLLLRDAEAGQ